MYHVQCRGNLISVISFKETTYAFSVLLVVLLSNKKYLLGSYKYWLYVANLLYNLCWFKDSRSTLCNIISKFVPSHGVTDVQVLQHSGINDIQNHWMPAVTSCRKSPWWCITQTFFLALLDLNAAQLIWKSECQKWNILS